MTKAQNMLDHASGATSTLFGRLGTKLQRKGGGGGGDGRGGAAAVKPTETPFSAPTQRLFVGRYAAAAAVPPSEVLAAQRHYWDYDLDEYVFDAKEDKEAGGSEASSSSSSSASRGAGASSEKKKNKQKKRDEKKGERSRSRGRGSRAESDRGAFEDEDGLYSAYDPVKRASAGSKGARVPRSPRPSSSSTSSSDKPRKFWRSNSNDDLQQEASSSSSSSSSSLPSPSLPSPPPPKQQQQQQLLRPHGARSPDESQENRALKMNKMNVTVSPLSKTAHGGTASESSESEDEINFAAAPPRPPRRSEDKKEEEEEGEEQKQKGGRMRRSTSTPYFDAIGSGNGNSNSSGNGGRSPTPLAPPPPPSSASSPAARSNVQHLTTACPGGKSEAWKQEHGANCWSAAPSGVFSVRGPRYKQDKKKEPSAEALYDVVGLDVLQMEGKAALVPLVERRDNNFLVQSLRAGSGSDRFILAVNFIMPWGNFVAYLSPKVRRGDRNTNSDGPWSPLSGDPRLDPMIARLASGDEAYCRARLKMVPHVVKGSWSIKKMVGSKPAIIGKVLRACHVEKRIQQRRNDSGSGGGSRFLEVQLDASSNRAARYLINAASNKGVVMDMGLVLQAETAEELPERILGGLRVHRLSDISGAAMASEDGGGNGGGGGGGGGAVKGGGGSGGRSTSRLGSASEEDEYFEDAEEAEPAEVEVEEVVGRSRRSAGRRSVGPVVSHGHGRSNSEEDDDDDERAISPEFIEEDAYNMVGFAPSPQSRKVAAWQRRLSREGSDDMEKI